MFSFDAIFTGLLVVAFHLTLSEKESIVSTDMNLPADHA